MATQTVVGGQSQAHTNFPQLGLNAGPSTRAAHVTQDEDKEFLRSCLEEADANSLRVALCQIAHYPNLEAMRVKKVDINGGAVIDYVLDANDQDTVRQMAFEFLLSRQQDSDPPLLHPSKTEASRLMDLYSDVPMKSDGGMSFDYDEGYEELAFEDFPREVEWTTGHPPPSVKEWKVIVIGAGISGIAAAIALKRLGIPFEVVERQQGVGGTWLQNNYPNVRVDSPAFSYQYRFTKTYKWKEHFPSGAKVLQYLETVAADHEITQHLHFGQEVTSAVWDEETSKWELILTSKTIGRSSEKTTCNAIISASGLFSTPKVPDIPGLESFKGPIFHTSRWDHSIPIEGKKVALIGTGSTGTQLAPALAGTAQHLTVYQRTPMWIVPFDLFRSPVTDNFHWLCDNIPFYWNWYCYGNFFKSLNFNTLQGLDQEWIAQGGSINKRNDSVRKALTEYIAKSFQERPDLAAKMMPNSAPLVRRMIVDNGFYEAVKRPNVDVVDGSIKRITETGIETAEGRHREFDIIALGSGFKVDRYLWPVQYIGRGGTTLEEAWQKDGARSYLGMAMPNYPNLFTMYGPNHQPRAGSFHSFSEKWARYAVTGIVGMIERGLKSMEVKKDVFEEYNARLDAATQTLLWETEGNGYFVNKHGRQGVNMPWTNGEYHHWIKELNFQDFTMN